MDYSLSEQQKILQQSAREFLRKQMPSALAKDMTLHETGHIHDVWHKMAQMGWMALAVPEEYDGCQMTFFDQVILLEEMGRASLPGPYFSTVLLGAGLILEAANEQQKRKLLPGVVTGDTILTVAIAEAEALYDPEAIATTAEPSAAGYRINGTKLFVPDAAVAHYLIGAARTAAGVSFFLVDVATPGLAITALPTMAGDKQYEVTFRDVVVPATNLLGEEGNGWPHWQAVMARAAIGRCAEMVGGAQQALDLTITHAKDRVQFGHPIGSFQAMQHHCANMLIDVETARWLTYEAAALLSEGLPCDKEVSMAKVCAGEASRRISALGIQIHGGMGFQWEVDLHLFYKQAMRGESTFGDAAYHMEVVARELGL